MERIAGAFLHCLRSRFGPWDHIRGFFYDLQDELECYSGASEGNFERDMRAAEELVKAVYGERSILSLNDPFAYAKVLECLWRYEDQGGFSNSSLINDLVIQALLELSRSNIAQQASTSAFQNIFVAANSENKRIVVVAAMLALLREPSRPLEELWQQGIVACVGTSAMRMEIVESALLEQCHNYHCLSEASKRAFLFCIHTLVSLPVFDSRVLRKTIWDTLCNASGASSLAYISLFQAVAEMDEANLMAYIESLISLLKRPNGEPKMEMQGRIYEAIDVLKTKLGTSIYEESLSQAFY